MMRRRFRRKSHWIWADSFSLSLTGASGTVVDGKRYNAALLLPPGRVKWFCDTVVRRAGVTVTGILLWLDFWWQNIAPGPQALPDVDMFIDVTAEDDAGNIQFVRNPFFEPQVPAAMAAWTDSASDGLDGFLWSHHIKGSSPPNAEVFTNSDGNKLQNQLFGIGEGSVDSPSLMCRTFRVAAEWQPDVHVRTKRRLRPDEGLMIGMTGVDASFPSPGPEAIVQVHTRIVAR